MPKPKTINPYVNKRQLDKDCRISGYVYCPRCGNKGKVLENVTLLFVNRSNEEKNPIICSKCNKYNMPLTIGFIKYKKGTPEDFLRKLFEAL